MGFDSADTAFMMVAAALVLFMTPGLAFFYGGLVGRKNVLTIMMQSFVSLSVTTIIWVVVGFSLSFGSDVAGGIIGNPADYFMLRGIAPGDIFDGLGIPVYVMVVYQLMFAIITPALMTGAFAGRMAFKSFLVFLVLWNLFVYYPFVHMVWGGGLLYEFGVLDFAGGIVVHEIAGIGALACVFFLGTRKVKDKEPHNIPFVALGTAMLWFGWFGFNAGSALGASDVAGLAFLNTQLGAAFAAATWMILDWRSNGKPTVVGFMVGAVAGLATVTPAAGFVSPGGAMIIGIAAGAVCYAAVQFRIRKEWDDALDVWAVHGIGGIVGTLLLGVFATTSMNADGADGLLHGNPSFFFVQLAAVVGAGIYAFVATYVLLTVINKITPVRVDLAAEESGLDQALHGEEAYLEA